MNAADLSSRVAALERRVGALESAGSSPAGAVAPMDGDQFWVLSGLRARVPERGSVVFAGSLTTAGGAEYEWQQGVLVDDLTDVEDVGPFVAPLAALAHPVRVRLLLAVLAGRHAAAELGAIEGSGTSGQLYHHLRQLTSAGWLRSTGRGRYEIPAERVVPALVVLAAARH